MIIIGRKDKIDLPELGLYNIDAKIDTGAYGSAIHCHHIEVCKKDDKEVLSFRVLDPTHPEYENKVFYANQFHDKVVKNSSGQSEHRYVIKAETVLFNKKYKTEFSLTDRKEMKYPILIGRKFLRNKFLVNVRLKDVSFNQK